MVSNQEELEKLNEELEKRYFSRAELIPNLKFPQTTDRMVIVLPNNEGAGFRLDCYDEVILRGHLTE